ncbi:MAG: MAPEG family protein [Steroidobacteraceae bacterium]
MAILWPAFALFALTMVVVFRLGTLRWRAVRRRQVDPRFYKIYRGDGEPEEVAAVSRHLINLYEAPTLFYAATAIAFAAGLSGTPLIAIGWTYAGLRLVHSSIHLGTNDVLWRFRVFAASWLALAAYWAVLAVELVNRRATAMPG